MVNSDVDSYAKTLNHRKIIRKTQKNNNQLKTKGILTPKYHLMAVRFSHLECQRRHFAPLPPVSYVTGYDVLFLHAVSCSYLNEVILGWKGRMAFTLIVTKQW